MKHNLSVRGQVILLHRKRRSRFLHNVVVVKVTIMVGLALAIWLPPEHREYTLLAINWLWLWRA